MWQVIRFGLDTRLFFKNEIFEHLTKAEKQSLTFPDPSNPPSKIFNNPVSGKYCTLYSLLLLISNCTDLVASQATLVAQLAIIVEICVTRLASCVTRVAWEVSAVATIGTLATWRDYSEVLKVYPTRRDLKILYI